MFNIQGHGLVQFANESSKKAALLLNKKHIMGETPSVLPSKFAAVIPEVLPTVRRKSKIGSATYDDDSYGHYGPSTEEVVLPIISKIENNANSTTDMNIGNNVDESLSSSNSTNDLIETSSDKTLSKKSTMLFKPRVFLKPAK